MTLDHTGGNIQFSSLKREKRKRRTRKRISQPSRTRGSLLLCKQDEGKEDKEEKGLSTKREEEEEEEGGGGGGGGGEEAIFTSLNVESLFLLFLVSQFDDEKLLSPPFCSRVTSPPFPCSLSDYKGEVTLPSFTVEGDFSSSISSSCE